MLRFDLNLVFTIINLILLYLVMRKFLFAPVSAIIEKRREEVEGQFTQANQAKEEAQTLKKRYEESMVSMDEEKERIKSQARKEAQDEYERIVEDARNKAQKVMADARVNAGAEREKMLKEAEVQITGLVVTAAAKVLAEEHSVESDRALYQQFLGKAGDCIGRNGN